MNEKEEKLLFEPEEPDPEKLEEQDLLGFMNVAEEEIIPDIESFKSPLIYGIYGRWGSGKTFMMRALQKCFEKDVRKGKYKTVWFDPWWYDHADREQLFLGLLSKIQRVIYPKGRKLKNLGVNVVSSTLALGRLAFDATLASTSNFEKYQKGFSKLIAKKQIEFVDAVENTHEELKDAVAKALNKAGAETLVLFVDDLDRCLPDRAILLLDQLKNFLYLPRVVTILGIDDEVFSSMLNTHYQYHWGHQYLDKIIRHAYRLGKGSIEKCLATYLPYSDWLRRDENMYFLRALANLWSMTGEINPRIVHRTMTTFLQIIKIRPLESMSFKFKYPTGFFEGNMRKEWVSFLTKMNGIIPLPASDSGGEFVKFTEDQCFGVCLWYTIALSKRFQLPLIQDKGGVLPLLLDPTEGFIPLWVVNRIYEIFKTWF
jgi:hypothetical protein